MGTYAAYVRWEGTGGPATPPPLFLDQNEARRADNFFL